MESKAVGRVGGHVGDAGEEALVGKVDERQDLLGVDMGCILSMASRAAGGRAHTLVLGRAGHLGEQLDKVGQVVAQELGLEDEVLARVPCVEGSSEKLGFADNAQGGAAFGALDGHGASVELRGAIERHQAYAEGKVGEALGQARQWLEAGAGLCNEGERRRGPGKVPAGELDAIGIAGLVLEGA